MAEITLKINAGFIDPLTMRTGNQLDINAPSETTNKPVYAQVTVSCPDGYVPKLPTLPTLQELSSGTMQSIRNRATLLQGLPTHTSYPLIECVEIEKPIVFSFSIQPDNETTVQEDYSYGFISSETQEAKQPDLSLWLGFEMIFGKQKQYSQSTQESEQTPDK